MTPVTTALPRTAQAMPVPKGNGSMVISLLLHALGIAGLLAMSFAAPRPPPAASVIELIEVPRPAPPAVLIPPPLAPSPVPYPVAAPAHKPPRPIAAQPPPSLQQPAPAPPASVRDESALAQADSLAAPSPETAVTLVLPSAVPPGFPTGPADSGQLRGVRLGLKGKLVSVTRLARMPVLTVASKPEYTAEMKKRNLAGKLRAKVLVDSDGKVKEARVISDLGFGTREAGLTALRKLEFDPGYADGSPVAVWIPFTFTFEWQE